MALFAFENMLFGLKKVGPPFTDIIRKIVFEGFFESETRRREKERNESVVTRFRKK